ncbi:MAG: bifunctional helix-turn-helix transcriptional regulator/GNAT family N-acetyltransferase [Pseudomonadota bacterium]
MPKDILSDAGYLALGSRLKRLADRLLADAAVVHAESAEPLQPGQFPLVAALDRYGPMTVNDAAAALGVSQPAVTRAAGELVKAGLAHSTPSDDDRRQRTLTLSAEGQNSIERLKRTMWPRVEAEARQLFSNLSGDMLAQVSTIEARLSERSMAQRVAENPLEIIPFAPEHAGLFHEINAEWIKDMFVLEAHDKHVLENPEATVIAPGGRILFVKAGDEGIVGTCALQPDTDGFTELTKMGVRSTARGFKAGEFLLRAALQTAWDMGATGRLYLVTNKKCEAAIHLYEKVGFVHDDEIMERFGSRYARCDVAMRYRSPANRP